MEEDWKDKWARYLLESVLVLVLTASFYVFVYLYYIGYAWKYPTPIEGISVFTFLSAGTALFTRFIEIGLCAMVIIVLYKYKQYILRLKKRNRHYQIFDKSIEIDKPFSYYLVFMINIIILISLILDAFLNMYLDRSIGYIILLIFTFIAILGIWGDIYKSIYSLIKNSPPLISVAILIFCIVMPYLIYFGIFVLPNIYGQNTADGQQNGERNYTQITFELYDHNSRLSGKHFIFITSQNGRYYLKDVNDSTEYIIQDSYVKTATLEQKQSNMTKKQSNMTKNGSYIWRLDDVIRRYLLHSTNKPNRSTSMGS